MNNTFKRFSAVIGIAMLGIVLSAIRTLIVHNNRIFNADGIGYYLIAEGSTLLFAIAMVVCGVGCVFIAMAFAKRIAIAGNRVTPSVAITAILCALAISSVGSVLPTMFTGDKHYAGLAIPLVILAILSAVRFAVYGIKAVNMKTTLYAWLCIAPPIYYIVRILADFTAQTASPMDSSGAYRLLSMIALMLFLMLEGKAASGAKINRLCAVFGFLSLLLVPVYTISTVVLFVTEGIGTQLSLYFAICDMVVFFYVTARMCLISSQREV